MRHLFRSMIIGCLVMAFMSSAAQAAPQNWRKQDPTAIYERALRYLKGGNFPKAIELFTALRNYHSDDPLSVKAQLAIADVQFRKKEYDAARFEYEQFARYHPRHEDMDYVTFQIGLSIYRRASIHAGRDQTTTRSAVSRWTGFETRFPESTYAEQVNDLRLKARARLASKELFIAKFYARRDAWGAVSARCDELLERYGDTSHVDEALYWTGHAKHAWGDVVGAQVALSQLQDRSPESRWHSKLAKVLQLDPGQKPKEEVFIRPYRVSGLPQQ